MDYKTPQDLIDRVQRIINQEVFTAEEATEAYSMLEYLINLDRQCSGFCFLMGALLMREKRYGLSEHWYLRALDLCDESKAELAAINNNLGFIAEQEGRREESLARFSKATELVPGNTEFYNNMGTQFVNVGDPKTAIDWCEKALAADPNNADARWNRGLAKLELGEWEEGFAGYYYGLLAGPNSSQKRKTRTYPGQEDVPYWDGKEGVTVAAYGEQGVGDEILAASVLSEVSDKVNLIYEAHPRLVEIFRHSFGEKFPIYGTRKVQSPELIWPQWQKIDAKAPIFNLISYCRKTDSDFPQQAYLKPYDNLVDKYREKVRKLGDRPKIGISWKGGSVLTRNDLRNIPIKDWVPFLKAYDVDWISVQYDPADQQGHNTPIVQELESETGLSLNHWPEVINDLDECYGGLIHALDAVISINSSVVHACGAYGVKGLTLTPIGCAWRYNVPQDDPDWYGYNHMMLYGPWVTQIRQDTPGRWDNVFEELHVKMGELQ